jgi:hypothetical protein
MISTQWFRSNDFDEMFSTRWFLLNDFDDMISTKWFRRDDFDEMISAKLNSAKWIATKWFRRNDFDEMISTKWTGTKWFSTRWISTKWFRRNELRRNDREPDELGFSRIESQTVGPHPELKGPHNQAHSSSSCYCIMDGTMQVGLDIISIQLGQGCIGGKKRS